MKKYYYTNEVSEKLKSVDQLPEWLKNFPGYREQIKMTREVLGLTQEQLGKRIGLSGRNIRRIESGEIFPNPDMLGKLAEALNSEIKILFVPKKNINDLLDELAGKKAAEIVKHAKANSALELQDPSKNAQALEVEKLKKEILEKKRNILWEK